MKPSPPRKRSHRPKPQQVRIIGGQWKRSLLPVAEVDGLRPTPDRVRETVFNWIGHLIGGNWQNINALDLFAGTGVLGFEAASRGAARAVLVETSPAALRQMDATREKLRATQVTVTRGDALAIAQRLAANSEKFDLIFLDPPYQQDWLQRALPVCLPLLKQGSLVYTESATPLDRFEAQEMPPWLAGWRIVRADRAGMVFYYLLQRDNPPIFEA